MARNDSMSEGQATKNEVATNAGAAAPLESGARVTLDELRQALQINRSSAPVGAHDRGFEAVAPSASKSDALATGGDRSQAATKRPDSEVTRETARPAPEKLWSPADAVKPTLDLFNQGKILEATNSLKALQDDSKNREQGAWRHEIEVLNEKIDFSKLDLKDVGQIMGTDKDGHLITASADLSKEQMRNPSNPENAERQFDLAISDFYGQQLDVDPAGAEQVGRVTQYKNDVAAAAALYVKPEQMKIVDNVTPIVDAFNNHDYATATEKLRALQEQDKSQETQVWLRHIEAINANLDFAKLGLNDVSQIFGVNDQGKLLTVSKDQTEIQTRDVKQADVIEKSENPNAYFTALNFLFADSKKLDQIAQVDQIMQEAKEARLPDLVHGMHHISFTADGEQREADIYVGKNVDLSKPAPVTYILHGAGPPPEKGIMEADTGANKWADDNNAIAVYGLAEEHTQPVGNLGGISGFMDFLRPDQDYHAWQTMPNSGLNETRLSYDDTHYLKALDGNVTRQLNIDAQRKVIFTFSDGSAVAKNGAVAIGASAVVEVHGGIKSEYKLPVNSGITYIAVNGEADQVMTRAGGSAYNGFLGNWEQRWPKLANVDPTRNFYEFAVANGCAGPLKQTTSSSEIRSEYRADQCTTGAPVVEIDRPNDGHAIDNPSPTFASRVFGLFLGQKDPTYDAFSAPVNEALKYPKKGNQLITSVREPF